MIDLGKLLGKIPKLIDYLQSLPKSAWLFIGGLVVIVNYVVSLYAVIPTWLEYLQWVLLFVSGYNPNNKDNASESTDESVKSSGDIPVGIGKSASLVLIMFFFCHVA